MDTIEVKTSELIGAALDWATACALNGSKEFYEVFGVKMLGRSITKAVVSGEIRPSTDWAQCGPMIENHGICILQYHEDCHDLDKDNTWTACPRGNDNYIEAPNPLIAACRVIVAQELGDTVYIPSEFIK